MCIKKKTVVIVGAGPAGLFSAYKFYLTNNLQQKYKVIVVDKGKSLENRKCPIRNYGINKCVNCSPCNIMCGFGGAGTFSDCKLSLTTDGVGGDINDYVKNKDLIKYLLNDIDYIFSSFDSDRNNRTIVGNNDDVIAKFNKKLDKANLFLRKCPTKHLGTDGTYEIMKNMYNKLESFVEFRFNTEVKNITISKDCYKVVVKDKNKSYEEKIPADYIILAPGRSGNDWLEDVLPDTEITKNKLDVGFRIELPHKVLKELTDNFYDMKIYKNYNDGYKVRTFCTNPYGFVSEEHYGDGIVLANGHAYSDKSKQKSQNTNFAVLVTIPKDVANSGEEVLADSFKNFVKNFSDNRVIVNNLKYFSGDTDTNNIVTNKTLKTAREDIKIPDVLGINNYVKDFLLSLDKIYPGVYSEETNVYGFEAKFYSDLITVNKNFETAAPNIYCVGDGSGITRGIIQSAMSGFIAASSIILK